MFSIYQNMSLSEDHLLRGYEEICKKKVKFSARINHWETTKTNITHKFSLEEKASLESLLMVKSVILYKETC